MRKISSFTLTELIIVLIVLAILAAIGIPIYQTTVAQNMINECTTQLEGIWEALKMYELDNDSFPDSLAKAWDGYGDKALAVVWERKKKEGDYIYLARMSFKKFKYFLANIFSIRPAYAQFSDFCADKGFLKCPADNALPSYGLLSRARNQTWEWISSNIGADEIIIGDCERSTFNSWSELAARHRRGLTREAEVLERGGEVTNRTYGDIRHQREEEDEQRRLLRERRKVTTRGTGISLPGTDEDASGRRGDKDLRHPEGREEEESDDEENDDSRIDIDDLIRRRTRPQPKRRF